jgi:GT2 family glycosyltransferase/glycosyltransferase involved in cell wall biosynthesis
MRVLIVVHGFPPSAQGGSEYYAEAQARALRDRHSADVLVFTRDADPRRPEFDVRTDARDGLTIVRVNNTFRSVRTFADSYRDERIDRIAAGTIDAFRPDVAHVHHLTCLSTNIVFELARRRVPCVFTLHDYWLLCHRGQLIDTEGRLCAGPEPDGCHNCLGPAADAAPGAFAAARALRAVDPRLPRAAARALGWIGAGRAGGAGGAGEARKRLEHMRVVCDAVTHFLAPSRAMLERFEAFGIPRERLTLVPYGVDPAPFGRSARAPGTRLRLGFLGSVMVSKAPHVLLEAFAGLPHASASVDVFGAFSAYHGDESYRTRIEPLLRQPGVKAHGAVPHDRVADALAAIDVLVVPSVWPENSPFVIKEAFLAGVPVVASRIGGIPEVVIDGVSGLLFEPGDARDLARVLTRLLEEPGLLDTLRRGLPRVPTLAEDVDETLRIYERVIRGPERVAAVVLNYRTPDDTFLAVRSLLMSARPPDEVLVVDNGPADAVARATDAAWPGDERVAHLATGRNLGFSGGMNVGIRAALARGADAVLLVNSDVIVAPDCVERLEQALAAQPTAGIAGPLVLSRSTPDVVASFGLSFAPLSGRMQHRGAGRPVSDFRGDGLESAGLRVVDAVSGCVMLVRRAVFDAVGLLDEAYFYSFEDLDFCLAAKRAGYTTLLEPAAVAYHEGARSIGKESPQRLYFAARNHLRLADRVAPAAAPAAQGRRLAIVALNLAHAMRTGGGSTLERIGAVLRGTRDYAAGRFGEPPA